ncbi:Recombinase [Peptoniphilus indolicus]|uniref:LambdaSa04 family prophage resolvase n=2 Tax=Peptoniphilus indolicus TaxID=33030 RepID=G4D528_9FIRM|nr:LambdaSa04 family prophage resolvase [Peptoniphilus indolicus ATCC 29427]SUB76370.1 Recombinase [Peptoniphilus indolicus]
MNTKVKLIKASNTGARNRNALDIDLKRVAAYCRVSTDSKDQLESYKSQVDYYTNLIKNNKNWTLAGIYADEATTGTTATKRADFMRLISDCQNGDIYMIITKSISRFVRNTLDTLTMDGELLLTILSSVAQQEVENTSAHVKKGLKMKMEKGELIGFQGCLGYDYDPTTKSISINEEEAKIVRYIFKRYLEGNGGSVIGRELEEQGYLTPRGKTKWSDTTVLGIIKNEKYIGDILMGKTFTVDPITKRRLANFGESDKYHIENHHEPIISREDFEKAQEIRLRRAQNRNTIANKDRKREKLSRQYAFSSMLECGFCGEILSRRTWHTSSIYKKINWQCVRSTKKGKKYCPHSKGIQEAAIEKTFVESYRQLCHADSTVIDDFLKIVEEEINDNTLVRDLKKIENQLNRIISQERKLVDLHLEDSIDEEVYAKKYKKLIKQKEELLDEKKTLELTIKDENFIKERLK